MNVHGRKGALHARSFKIVKIYALELCEWNENVKFIQLCYI